MRAIHLSDLHHATCALRALPPELRKDAAHAALIKAHYADHYRKALGKTHPTWGNGSLTSVFGPVDEPARCDTAYLEAMATLITALLAERRA